MNRTKTTSTTRRRQCLRHAALALCAVLLALVAASCTADPLDGRDTPNAGNGTNPDDVLTFAVAPRPGFTEAPATRATDTKAALIEQEIAGQARNDRESAPNSTVIPGLTRDLPPRRAGLSLQEIAGQARNDRESARNDRESAPSTRAEQTPGATCWEQGDILWIQASFFHNKQDYATHDTTCVSALKYDGAKWRYLTPAEADAIGTGSIPRFSRLVRRPRGSADWADPGIEINAYYTGSGKPGADGTLTITPDGGIPDVPLITGGSGMYSPDMQPIPLTFYYFSTSRVRIPAGYKVELTDTKYWSTIELTPDGKDRFLDKPINEIPAQPEDTNVFLFLNPGGNSTATLTRDGVSCTFTFPEVTDAEGRLTRDSASYTFPLYTSGTETPGGYDLTIADEAGLRAFAQAVNAGDSLPNGKPAAEARVLQTANIHLTQGEWVPIGTGRDNPFRGAYNGNGNEISGLTITTAPQPDAYNRSYAGLFGRAEGAVLTGIRLRGVEINITQVGDVNLNVGSIAGWLENSTLSLCTADGTVNTDRGAEVAAGGIVGISQYSTISRCRADVKIKAAVTKGSAAAYAGGIAGKNGWCNFILSCETRDRAVTVEGNLQAYAGGITGTNSGLIAFCRTGANVVTAPNSTSTNRAGGLVGVNAGFLYSCYSRAKATVAGHKQAGAIVGFTDGQNLVQHCYATGDTGEGTSNLNAVPDNIVYNTNPKDGDIFRVMTGFTGKVESISDGGTTYYPFTTSYTPSATPAYGIIPQRAVWTKDAWKDGGSDPKFPEIDIEAYEGK